MTTTPLPLNRLTMCFPLHGGASTRQLEQAMQATLDPHTLMQRAADAVFRLSVAVAPHARRVWVACGPGNNGGDGLLVAARWAHRLRSLGDPTAAVTVTRLGSEASLPADARWALEQAQQSRIRWAEHPPEDFDLGVDALYGIGLSRPVDGIANDWIDRLQTTASPVVCIDLPSGLDGDDGGWWSRSPCRPSPNRHTLSLLTLKPGLFTHMGRTAAGRCWWDDLGLAGGAEDLLPPSAWLYGQDMPAHHPDSARHHIHKGTRGDVLVIGGETDDHGNSMLGAARLAARAALRAGAGRVYLASVGQSSAQGAAGDPLFPEVMARALSGVLEAPWAEQAVWVCGCGGGASIAASLPAAIRRAPALVLDADALNALASSETLQEDLTSRAARGCTTVLTPHPLEAARLLGGSAAEVQARRRHAAQTLADRYRCVVALKGSGTVVTAPGSTPYINPTGSGLLATAGTGDVLAGLIGGLLCDRERSALAATLEAVYRHGMTVNRWSETTSAMLASDVVERL